VFSTNTLIWAVKNLPLDELEFDETYSAKVSSIKKVWKLISPGMFHSARLYTRKKAYPSLFVQERKLPVIQCIKIFTTFHSDLPTELFAPGLLWSTWTEATAAWWCFLAHTKMENCFSTITRSGRSVFFLCNACWIFTDSQKPLSGFAVFNFSYFFVLILSSD